MKQQINNHSLNENVEMPKNITLGKEVKIPGTNIILEKGDKITYKEAFDPNKFENLIPHSMRAKEYTIVGDVLYWITEEIFDVNEAKQFAAVLNKYTSFKKALVISRYDTNWDYMKDLNDDESTFIDFTSNESITKKNEDVNEDEVIFEDSNFIFKKHYFVDYRKEEHFDYRVLVKRGSIAENYVVEIYIEHWNKPEIPESIIVKYGLPGSMLNKSISTFISVLQSAMKFADKVAAYLKIKVINR